MKRATCLTCGKEVGPFHEPGVSLSCTLITPARPDLDSIQWTGKNTPQIKAWMVSVLHRDGQPVPDIALFVKRRSSGMSKTLFTNLLDDPAPEITAAMWTAANSTYVGLVNGDWIAKDMQGFFPTKTVKEQDR